jgi:hypothetical protein
VHDAIRDGREQWPLGLEVVRFGADEAQQPAVARRLRIAADGRVERADAALDARRPRSRAPRAASPSSCRSTSRRARARR